MDIFDIKNLTFSYPLATHDTLENISFSVRKGEFFTICGAIGCGKTTLIQHLKPAISPHGARSGAILFEGSPIEDMDHRAQASKIGYIFQNPDEQIVTDKVWHELAFGLESLGYDKASIRLKVAEIASYFDLQSIFHSEVATLSGGQKQLLNLASIMAMNPDVLILDEPTSQLDPIHASKFLDIIKKLNQDLGLTVIIIEHRLEEILPISDRVLLMNDGKIELLDSPVSVCSFLSKTNHDMLCAMPSAVQIFAQIAPEHIPLTSGQARVLFESYYNQSLSQTSISNDIESNDDAIVLSTKNLSFRYEKHGKDILSLLSFQVTRGSFYAIVGANGVGKSTLLSVISKIHKPYSGKLFVAGKVATLPQNPQSLFLKKTVWEDLLTVSSNEDEIKLLAKRTKIDSLFAHHPFDLSGGEQQRVALTKVLLKNPDILLLDEPTKGLDAHFKEQLADLVKELTLSGVTVIMVSHDIEFCAKHASKCAMMFDGCIISEAETRSFFASNHVYTTASNKITRNYFSNAITVEDVIYLWKQKQTNKPS